MKKVYLVVSQAVYGLEDCGLGTQVFASEAKALECFRAMVTDEKRYIGEDWIVKESEWSFEAWEDGDWTRNHTRIEVRDIVVE